MVKQEGRLSRSTKAMGTIAAAVLLFGGAAGASAQQFKTFPGSSCQASGSAQDLYYSGPLIANRTNSTSSAVCPLVRTNEIQAWQRIYVFVRDRHSTQDIQCRAEARDLSGSTAWSETKSSSGEGNQAIVFGPPGAAVPAYGTYSVVCSLPPMEEVNQPSYIVALVTAEP